MPRTERRIEIQRAWRGRAMPLNRELRAWAEAALGKQDVAQGLVIRVVDEAESQSLNAAFRGKDRPTNVLSFPFEGPPELADTHLGDLVICAPVVAREAREQGKTGAAHWAHMVVHGILHLLGFDHQDARSARAMEREERAILERLGFPDPYTAD
jgi:probable rRNA maturation factor